MAGGSERLTIAEYFRHEVGRDVLLLMDNVFGFVQAGSEVSGLLGRLPSRVGYQPTLATEIAELQQRITSVAGATVTAIQAWQDVIALLGIEELSAADRLIVRRARRLQRFRIQPFMVTDVFTGKAGRTVALADLLQGCRAILDGVGDDWAESSFYMVGTLEEARQKEAAAQRDAA